MLVFADAHDLTRAEGEVEAGRVLTIDGDAVAGKNVLGTIATDAVHLLQDKIQKSRLFTNDVLAVFGSGVLGAGHISHTNKCFFGETN